MNLQLGVNKGTITNVPVDVNDVQRPVDGPIICTATPDGVVHLEPSPDGSTCDVVPVGLGTATYVASADADPDPNKDTEISGNLITIIVSPAPLQEAVKIVSTEGAVVPQ